jgi:hypothetical protein
MASQEFSPKRAAIDKANARLLTIVAITVFIAIFSLVASKALLDQRAYQARVIAKKEQARDTLKDNIAAVETLNSSYQEFANSSVNVLGGSPSGKGDKDGENPRIVLDALPSKYDFPALTTSIEKLLKDNNISLDGITGTDDEVAQSANVSSDSPTPSEIPFTIEANTSANKSKDLVELFERSIRPFKIKKLQITGEGGQLKVTLDGVTYYQPSKTLSVRNEVVK